MTIVEVLVSDAAKEYVKAHGGTAFVRAHSHRCCTGPLTLLDVTTAPPRDDSEFESATDNGVEVRLLGGTGTRPNQVVIELRGVLRRRPVAYWDGWAFRP
jgi:hypothetical protein